MLRKVLWPKIQWPGYELSLTYRWSSIVRWVSNAFLSFRKMRFYKGQAATAMSGVTGCVCEKNRQKCSPTNFFRENSCATCFPWSKVSQNFLPTSVIKKKTGRRKQSPYKSRKCAQSGVDVMIIIFCDFRNFSSKKLRFSQKPMLRSNFFSI
jgi:hypothetical protein